MVRKLNKAPCSWRRCFDQAAVGVVGMSLLEQQVESLAEVDDDFWRRFAASRSRAARASNRRSGTRRGVARAQGGLVGDQSRGGEAGEPGRVLVRRHSCNCRTRPSRRGQQFRRSRPASPAARLATCWAYWCRHMGAVVGRCLRVRSPVIARLFGGNRAFLSGPVGHCSQPTGENSRGRPDRHLCHAGVPP